MLVAKTFTIEYIFSPHKLSHCDNGNLSRWLVKKGKNEEAARTLAKVRGAGNLMEVVPELTDIKASLKAGSSPRRSQTCRFLFSRRIMQRYVARLFSFVMVFLYWSYTVEPPIRDPLR